MFVKDKLKWELLMLSLLVIALFALSYLVVNDSLNDFDERIYQFISSMSSLKYILIAQILVSLGSLTIIMAFILIIVALLKDNKAKALIIINTLMIYLLTTLFQGFIRRLPPLHLHMIKVEGFVFPSIYVSMAAIFYGAILLYVLRKLNNQWLRNIFVGVFVILILVIGMACVYIGTNHFTDVVAGLILAMISYLITRLVLRLWQMLIDKKIITLNTSSD